MRADVVALDVSARRRSLIGYSLGMAVYTFVVVAMYPAFEHSTSLNDLIKSDATAAALFGVSGDISSTGGWLNGNIYANFFPLLMLLLTIGYGAAAIAGQNEDGTLCLLATLPRPRSAIAGQKLSAMVLQAAVLAAAVAAVVLAGRWFDLTITVTDAVAISASTLLLGIDFGVLAMAVGALTGTRGTALGVASAAAAASYLVSSLAPVVSWIRPARYASLFYWSVGNNQISNGVSVGDYLVLLAVAAAGWYATVVAFRRLDLH